METRRNIHDERNSLAGPRPSDKNLRRRNAQALSDAKLPRKDREYKTMPIVPKLVANTICVWCSAETITGTTFVICPRCQCCQYCGLISKNRDHCLLCGNTAEADMIQDPPARKRAYLKPSDEPHSDNCPITHSGPITRSRRPGMRRSA